MQTPNRTEGPYPGDGSNGYGNVTNINALSLSGIVRSDIRSSFAGVTGTAAGIPLTVNIKVVTLASSCATPASRAIYLWHCNQVGYYSLYSQADQNYLRGVQETDSNGLVTFTTIFPACYSGRWPHIHFEVYPSAAAATSYSTKTNTSQIAMPAGAACDVFATTGYEASVSNFANTALSTDNVFSPDSGVIETPVITGDVTNGYVLSFTVVV